MLGFVGPLKAGVRAVAVMGLVLAGMAGTVVFANGVLADGASVSGPELAATAKKDSDDLLLLEKDGKDELLDTDSDKKGAQEQEKKGKKEEHSFESRTSLVSV